MAKEMPSFEEDESLTFKSAHDFFNAGGGKDDFQEGDGL